MMNERLKVMKEYVGTDADRLLTDTLAFRFFNDMYHSPEDSFFLSVYDSKDQFSKVYGSWVIDKWWRVWYDHPEILRQNGNEDILYNADAQSRYMEMMNKHNVNDCQSIVNYYRMLGASLKSDWQQTLSMAKEYAATDKIWDLNFVHICDRLLQYLQDKSQRAEVISIIENRLKQIENVEDLPNEASMYYIEGKRVGPIGRSKIYYKSIIKANQ